MNRRNFLQALGLGGSATALQACGLDDNLYFTPVEHILPYVVRPEHTTPGMPTFYATSVGLGPRAWPVLAHHRDGRVINLSANRRAPVPPLVPGAQLLEIQRHWSPDRILDPKRGGQVVEWSAASSALADGVKAARAAGKKVAYLGPYRSGSIVGLLQNFTQGSALFWEPLGRDAEILAARALFGPEATLPRYDLTEARFVLSFGAPFLSDAWGSPGLRTQFARAKNANEGQFVTKLAVVTPLKDQTSANADHWYACVPGSEAKVAMAVARLVAEQTDHDGPARALVAGGDPDAAAAASGLPVDAIRSMAATFAAGGAVALPGGLAGASTGATELAAAVYLLNIVAAGRGLFTTGGYAGPISTAADVATLIDDMDAGRVGVLLIDDVDPVHHLADGVRFAAALGKVDLAVSVSSFPSETSAACTLVLATADATEDWGDEEPWAGFHVVRQPAAQPRGNVRSLGDVLLAVWRAIDPAGPQGTWRDHVRERWADDVWPAGPVPVAAAPAGSPPAPTVLPPEFEAWWTEALAAGFVDRPKVLWPLGVTGALPPAAPPGEAGAGELYLQVFPHAFVLDGRYANEPWAQESPDPLTGQVWGTWALVHPATAEKLGVANNDTITIQAGGEAVEVAVEVHPLVHPDVVAVPLGGGHSAAKGRYAEITGVNIVRALGARRDASGALAVQGARCTVAKTGRTGALVSTFGHDQDESRNFVNVVDAATWAAQGDAEREHPGDLTGIHHLPMDSRLVAAEEAWRRENPEAEPEHREYTSFYPVPDHPTYRFALTVDTNACNGCGACAIACYAENNLAIVGRDSIAKRRQMSWIRVNRYFADHTEDGSPSVHFVPMMCQHCGHAPCESVCPVLATYHTIDGLNAMIYNRCVGTRYCANACPYSVRRFNYHSYTWPEPFHLQLNPDVSARTMGVMEKCTFCVQRIRRTKSAYRDQGYTHTVPDEALRQLPACADACPSQALTFGNLLDPASVPASTRKSGRSYFPIAEINTYPAVNYLSRASYAARRADHDAHAEAEPAEAGRDAGGH